MASSVRLEFGPWEPDAALLEGAHSPEACNAIPARRGWKPLPGASPLQLPPLPSAVKAAFTTRGLHGTDSTFAATAEGIYALEGQGWACKFQGASALAGRAFAAYGDAVYALFGSSLVKSRVAGTASDFTAVEGAPAGEVLGVIRDFLVLGRLSERKDAIRWSGFDRPDEWPALGTNEAQAVQSDTQVFPEGGQVQAVLGSVGGADGLIFLERGIQRATYVGTPYIFQFDAVDATAGCRAPGSPVSWGAGCAFLAEDGWRLTDGAGVRRIGAGRVDGWFFAHCDPGRIAEVRGVHDGRNGVALWSFPSGDAAPGLHDRLLIYHYGLDRWSCGRLETEALFADVTRGGVTLEALDAFGSLDSLPFSSLDLPMFRNGAVGVTSCFDAGHRLANLTGPALEATLDTAEHGGRRIMLHGFRPLVDAEALAMPAYRSRQMDARRWGTPRRPQRDGVCRQHLSTVYVAARLTIPAGSEWHHALGVEALVEQEE